MTNSYRQHQNSQIPANIALRVFIVVLFAVSFSLHCFAGEGDECGGTDSKKARKLYESAMNELKSGKTQDAYKMLAEATQEDPEYANAWVEMAYLNFRFSDDSEKRSFIQQADIYYNKAVSQYEKAAAACPSINNYDVCIWLCDYYYQKRNFEITKKYVDLFINNVKQHSGLEHIKVIKRKIDKYYEMKSHPVPFNPVKIANINTDNDEYLPLVSPDGEMFFYTQKYNRKIDLGNFQTIEEFKVSERDMQTAGKLLYKNGVPMQNPFNTGSNQGAASVTIDNRFLYVTISEMSRTQYGPFQNFDIWVSEYLDGAWQPLKNLGPNVNGRITWESQPSISADGKTLYFATVRKENIGFNEDNNTTSDIWMSQMDENGNWKKAVNLGPVINTSGNEKSPFIHSDSQTLYFSSDGHDGMGGYDIFYSKRNPDGTWQPPKNIGYPINTGDDEIGLIVSNYGNKAYFSSNKLNNNSNLDIYEFEMPLEARPQEVLFVKGQLTDDEGKELEDAKIKVENVKTEEVFDGMIDKMTGRYAVVIPVKKPDDEYLLTVKKRDYAFTSQYIAPKDEVKKEEPIKVNLVVKPIEVDQTVQLNNIYFSTASADLVKQSLFVLDRFVDFLKENPKIKIEIHGHTDNEGIAENNQTLSERRAKAVRDYLLLEGLDPSRIVAWKGFGQNKPVASNDTPEGRAKNRRTEFVIVSK